MTALTRESLKDQLKTLAPMMADVLPKHLTVDRLAKTALIAVNQNPKILECTMASVAQSMMVAASLGLDVGGSLGSAYLVPFNQRVGKGDDAKWETRCQLIIGYRGFIDLARRSGKVKRIEAHVVYEGDDYQVIFGLDPILTHTPKLTGQRGKLVFVYAVAELEDGVKQLEVMTLDEIEKIRQSSQTGKDGGKYGSSGPWADHYEEMARKSVVRRLMKYLPLSPELNDALTFEDTGRHSVLDVKGEVLAGEETAAMLSAGSEAQQSRTAAIKDKLRKNEEPDPSFEAKRADAARALKGGEG